MLDVLKIPLGLSPSLLFIFEAWSITIETLDLVVDFDQFFLINIKNINMASHLNYFFAYKLTGSGDLSLMHIYSYY